MISSSRLARWRVMTLGFCKDWHWARVLEDDLVLVWAELADRLVEEGRLENDSPSHGSAEAEPNVDSQVSQNEFKPDDVLHVELCLLDV